MNKKVLMLLTNAFDPDPRVYMEASALLQNGYDVTIVCWDRDRKAPEFEDLDGIKIERIYLNSTHGRGSTQIFFLFLFWLKAFLKEFFKKFDVIHCHDFDTLPLGFILAKLKKTNLIYDSHESYVDMLYEMPILLKRAIYLLENFLIKYADIVITVGEILKEYFIKRGARNIYVVGNWKDPQGFVFNGEELKREKDRLGISEKQRVISFIANLGKERQVPQLIEAVKQTPDAYLIIGGDGPYKDIADKSSQNYQNIYYLGYVHPLRVPFYTAISDIIFYGFDLQNPNAKFSAPNKLFEGLAAGKPLITGNFGEIGRIIKETQSGIILNNYSAAEIKHAISNLTSNVIMRLSENAKKAAKKKYCWDKAKNVLLESYQSLK